MSDALVRADAKSAPGGLRAVLGARRRFALTRSRVGLVSLVVVVAVVAFAALGPLLAPHGEGELVGPPFADPSSVAPLGTDLVGRDVLSRMMFGGWRLLLPALIGTVLAYVIGISAGITVGFRRSLFGALAMRATDVLFAFPSTALLLLTAFALGPGFTTVVVVIVIAQGPAILRVVRAATLDLARRGFVEAAIARGDRLPRVFGREILPNLANTLIADLGPRLCITIFFVATLGFFGLGTPPPAADWASMLYENRGGFFEQPWAVLAPTLAIALLTIAINLVGDTIARGLGRSDDVDRVGG